jgi:hypothetical protein
MIACIHKTCSSPLIGPNLDAAANLRRRVREQIFAAFRPVILTGAFTASTNILSRFFEVFEHGQDQLVPNPLG